MIRAVMMLLVAIAAQPVLAAPASMQELLEQVRQRATETRQAEQAREQAFLQRRDQQRQQLNAVVARQRALEREVEQLEALYHRRQQQISEQRAARDERLGALKAVFGVLQDVAGEQAGVLRESVTSAEYPERSTFALELAERAASGTSLPSVQDIRQLWFEMQREMTESGRVVRFTAPVIRSDGSEAQQEVVRVGAFNLIAADGYLQYRPDSGRIAEPARQPQRAYRQSAVELHEATDGTVAFGIDPARGSMLDLLGQTPRASERIHQGGLIGYIILGLGGLALLLALERFLSLSRRGAGIRRQARSSEIRDDNALGRILAVQKDSGEGSLEHLESRLGEAVLKEIPPLTRFLPLLRLIAVTTPLLGLLGTIVGMINTFQSLTLFGSGDPRLMAGGISQALVTTMLGLSVAIPTLLLHTLLNSQSRRLIFSLEEQTAGIIARRLQEEDGS